MNPNTTHKHSIKVIISEALMFLAVILTVAILALLVSGYWLSSDFKVERNGMLQVSSIPTGANIEIDGQPSSWLERTNSSKILSSGEHSVKLTKEGYDSWSKTINISEGLLYRLLYPRLFLQQRFTEKILDVGTYTGATISPDYNSLVLFNDTTNWGFVNLDTDKPTIQSFDVSSLFQSPSADGGSNAAFLGEITSADWDFDSSHILIATKHEDSTEWILLDVHNINKSINLTKEFDVDFSDIEIMDNNSNTLLAIRDNNLYKMDVSSRALSAVLVKNVNDFDHYHNEIVFSATRESVDNQVPAQYYVGYLKLGNDKITELEQIEAPAKVIISKFYDEKNIIVTQYNKVTIHNIESYDDASKEYYLPFSPNQIKAGYSGEFLSFSQDNNMASLDMEANTVREWTIEDHHAWLDGSMIYAVSDGELVVYDFDGLNRRAIAKNVSSHFPVTITSDKWLYYFSDGELIREWLINK